MPEKKSHWPFGSDAGTRGARDSDRALELESERARLAEQTALRQRMRHDRMIVGGRAHTKKSGLS
jgi:hypothetical protein